MIIEEKDVVIAKIGNYFVSVIGRLRDHIRLIVVFNLCSMPVKVHTSGCALFGARALLSSVLV